MNAVVTVTVMLPAGSQHPGICFQVCGFSDCEVPPGVFSILSRRLLSRLFPGPSLLGFCFGSSSVDVFLFQISYEISLALVLIPPLASVVWFLPLRVLTPPSLTFNNSRCVVCDRSGPLAMRLSVEGQRALADTEPLMGLLWAPPMTSALPAETAPGFLRPGLLSAPASPVLAGQSCWGPAVQWWMSHSLTSHTSCVHLRRATTAVTLF